MAPRSRWLRHLMLLPQPSPIADAKRAARTAARRRRAELHPAPGAGRRAAAHLVAHLARLRGHDPVAGYIPRKDEFDPLPAMRLLHGLDLEICVPVVADRERPLAFRAWTPTIPLVRRAFGVLEPESGPLLTPRLLLVPLLAFDRRGHRLGYGGGFYDRTLAALRADGPVTAIGIAFARQEVDRLPVEPTDAPLDAIVTEDGLIVPHAA